MIRFSTIFEPVSYLSLPQNGYQKSTLAGVGHYLQKSTLAGEDPKIFASAERGGAVWPGPGGFRKRNPEGSSWARRALRAGGPLSIDKNFIFPLNVPP